MEPRTMVQVTTDNWSEIVDMINWRQMETVDRSGNRILKDTSGLTAYCIPFDVWYETRAYNKIWRRFTRSGS